MDVEVRVQENDNSRKVRLRNREPNANQNQGRKNSKAQLVEQFIPTLWLNYKTSRLLTEFLSLLSYKSLGCSCISWLHTSQQPPHTGPSLAPGYST